MRSFAGRGSPAVKFEEPAGRCRLPREKTMKTSLTTFALTAVAFALLVALAFIGA